MSSQNNREFMFVVGINIKLYINLLTHKRFTRTPCKLLYVYVCLIYSHY